MPILYYDPWKSNETSVIYLMRIDGDDPNCRSHQRLEENENIRVVRMRIDERLLERVVEYCKLHSLRLEAKIYSMCVGIWLKHNLGQL